jgi:hypothetical protein
MRLVEHEEAIAAIVDQRYARLAPALVSEKYFQGKTLDDLRRIISDG